MYFIIYMEIKFKFYYWWNKSEIYLYIYNNKKQKSFYNFCHEIKDILHIDKIYIHSK